MRTPTTGITVPRGTLTARAGASRIGASLLAGVLALAGTVSAAAWPEKPLRVVVAFPAGGMADIFTRTLQPRLSESLGQPLVVENRGGAGGTVAEALVAKSAPDGYTMMVGVDSIPANPHLFRNLKYDLFRDLIAVTKLARVPLVLLVHPSVPASSPAEFVAYARTQHGRLSTPARAAEPAIISTWNFSRNAPGSR
jgi:tripartite-type tricarboxylate transporter receptor subunit TctC